MDFNWIKRSWRAMGRLYLCMLWGALVSAALVAVLALVCAGALRNVSAADYLTAFLSWYVFLIGPLGAVLGLLVGVLALVLRWTLLSAQLFIAAIALLGTLVWGVLLWPQLSDLRQPVLVVTLVVLALLLVLAVRGGWRRRRA